MLEEFHRQEFQMGGVTPNTLDTPENKEDHGAGELKENHRNK